MSSEKNYKGQLQVIEGSMVNEALVTSKIAYDSNCQIEYLAEVKVGVPDDQNRHFINKFQYDPAILVVTKVMIAQNVMRTGATSATIAIRNAQEILLTCVGSDFSEALTGDEVSINTALNPNKKAVIVSRLSNTSMIVSNTGFVTEVAAPVAIWDIFLTLKNDATMDYARRRWDHRLLYVYS